MTFSWSNIYCFASLYIFSSVSAEPVDCHEATELILEASPYLFPFVLEYSLIATGIFTIMYSEIDNNNQLNNIRNALAMSEPKQDGRHQKTSCGSRLNIENRFDNITNGDNQSTIEEDIHSVTNPADIVHTNEGTFELTSSHRGMFLGFLLFAGSVVAIIMFFHEVAKENTEGAQLCYLITDITLELLLLTSTMMSLYSLNKLSYKPRSLGVDDILLLIAMAGSYLFEISVLVANAFYLANEDCLNGHVVENTEDSAEIGVYSYFRLCA